MTAQADKLSRADLSIIIVNWNSVQYLRDCLGSIYGTTRIPFEVIVVDNASFDGSGEMLRREFPNVKYIQNETNAGFARANNIGFAHSTARMLLFLNPDTQVIGSALSTMLDAIARVPDAGALSCRLLNSDLTVQTSCIQPLVTVMNQLLDIEYLRSKFPSLKLWGIKGGPPQHNGLQEVEAVSGACMLVKRNVFESVGMFSTDYFMYGEDVDLCNKIQKAGYKIYHLKGAEVIHHGGSSVGRTGIDSFNDVLKRESISLYLRKTRGRGIVLLYRSSMFFAAVVRLAVIVPLMPVLRLTKNKDAFNEVLLKWVRVLKWSLGLEKWAREATRLPMEREMKESCATCSRAK